MFEKAKELQEMISKCTMTDGTRKEQYEQLAELLEMQQALDTAILKDKELETYPQARIKIALFVEIGELLNELPSIFKYWKETATDDKTKALVEYVDALHFALSLTNYNAEGIIDYIDQTPSGIWDVFAYIERTERPEDEDPEGMAMELAAALARVTDTILFFIEHVLEIGMILDFSWDEIYKIYKEKNAVNYQRLQEGY